MRVRGLYGNDEVHTRLQNIFMPYRKKDNEKTAKRLLIKFYKAYSKLKPDDYYWVDSKPSGYIFHLIHLREQLVSKKYENACFEIQRLLRKEPFLQARVYYNMIDLLDKEIMRGE